MRSVAPWSTVMARHGQCGDRVLERLVRRDPAHREPDGARSGVTAQGTCVGRHVLSHRGRRRHDRSGGKARLGQVGLVVRRIGDGKRRPWREHGQVLSGALLAEGEMVVPRRHELRWGDVVVVHDQRLGPARQPGGHERGGGELIDDDVATVGLVGVGDGRKGLVRRLVLHDVDEDVGFEAPAARRVSQPQRVPADRVAAVKHGDEVVDPAHVAGVAAEMPNRSSPPVPAGNGVTSTNPLRSSRSSQVSRWRAALSTMSCDVGALPRKGAEGLGNDHDGRAACERTVRLGEQRQDRVQRQPVHHAAQHQAAERRGGSLRQVFADLADRDVTAALEGPQRHTASGLDAGGRHAALRERADERTLTTIRMQDLASGGPCRDE